MAEIEEEIENYSRLIEKWISETNENPIQLEFNGLKIRILEVLKAIKDIKNGNFQNSKQHFYVSSLIDELRIKKFNDNQLSYGLPFMAYPILSDHEDLIHRYAKLRYLSWGKMPSMDDNIAKGRSDVWCNTVQLFMLNDTQGIEKNLNLIETISLNKLTKKEEGLRDDYEFFKALNNCDKNKMEEILEKLVSPKIHKKRNINNIQSEYISFPAIGYAKLAWRKNIQVEVNSKLLPKDLLPINPLEKYDLFYDFLK